MAARQAASGKQVKQSRSGKAAGSQRDASKLRANAKQASTSPEPLMSDGVARDIAGVALAVFAVASFISVIAPTTAPVADALAKFYHMGFGVGGYVVPLALLLVAALIFVRKEHVIKVRSAVGAILIFVAVISLITIARTPEYMVLGVTVGEADLSAAGGYLGFAVSSVLASALGKPIACVVLIGLALAGAVLIGFSITDFVVVLRERAELIRARHHVEVNTSPWGDADALDKTPAPVQPHRAPRAHAVSDEDGTAVTTFLGDRERTTLITDEPDDPDEDPIVDVSAQVAAEKAQTTLIPVADKYVAREHTADAVDAPGTTVAFESPGAPVSDSSGRTSRAVGEDGSASAAAVGAEAAAPSSSVAVDGSGASPASHATPVSTAAEVPETPAIPDFLLHPHGSSTAGDVRPGGDEDATGERAADPLRTAASAAATTAAVSAAGAASTAGAAASAAPEASEQDEDGDERRLPPLSMLRHNPHSASSASSDTELRQTSESLQATLQEFNLHSRVVGWISGPTVTTFKVQPGEGERVSRISSLEDDIALSLAAQSVRIFAPIPGTSLVGIEIPNRKRQNVNLGDVLPYVQGGPLELAIGRDAEGSPIVADLAKMPHLLIAGTTGSGKSVMINSIIMALLMRTFPDDVRLIMVDPKRVELAGYNGLPHLYVPVVTEPKQAASALQWAVSEMERRLKVFERVGVRKISTFNEKQASSAFDHYDNPPSKMPYLVIIIDELSDLMMVAGKDVEASIVRIAQLGRAAGIHLIVATQRPSSNVVTGLIKANITNRIAFNVATGIDSRVIIDQTGAEKLTGYGDMLFSRVDWGKPKRIQGCFVSDEEIAAVTEFVKAQGEADYHEEILSVVTPAAVSGGGGSAGSNDDDPLMWEAAHIVVESGLGSTSGLQRRLKVGYARAGRIMDMLEEKGIVGPPDGSKPREVLLDAEGLAELEALESRMSEEDEMGGF